MSLPGEDLVPPFLLSSARFGIQLGLMRMQSLLRRLGNPENACRVIHVAGTNGKGSVTSYLATSLACAGYRTGVYTSPYLERFHERIRVIDGQNGVLLLREDEAYGEIDHDSLFRLSDLVERAVRRMVAEGEEHPTEFELVTAVAFLYFRETRCQYVVLETGLGGRLDSTNVIDRPVATIITSLGFDHTDRLGNTMAEIAAEKGGIIKNGCPLYFSDPHDSDLSSSDADTAEKVIRDIAEKRSAPLMLMSSDRITVAQSDEGGQTFGVDFFPEPLRVNLLGEYQMRNAALAVAALIGICPPDAIREGLRLTKWKGRLEVLRRSPLILLDGGHNPQGARSFRRTTEDLFAALFLQHPPILILGFMRDKDAEGILRELFGGLSYRFRSIFLTAPDNPRSMSPTSLERLISERFSDDSLFYNDDTSMYNRQGKIFAFQRVSDACRAALDDSESCGAPILCVGSLYLAGEARPVLKNL
jgi:dihydrofolate synthase/folylpolyglutamate synthase